MLACCARERVGSHNSTLGRWRLVATSILLLCGAALLPSQSQAAFPGRNGRIAFVNTGFPRQLLSVRSNGSGKRILGRRLYAPTWSRSGRHIAFEVPGDAGSAIGIARADGRGRRRVTNVADAEPSWSPDGHHIAFFRQDPCAIYSQNEEPCPPKLEASTQWGVMVYGAV
jgi:Tol biopolymer transport system component